MSLTENARNSPVALTNLDVDILLGLSGGETYKSLASSLHVSAATVAYHIKQMHQKLGTKSAPALVALAIVSGLLTNDLWPIEASGLLVIQGQ